jgi:hypothetical protein
MRSKIETYPADMALSGPGEIQGKFVQFEWQGTEYLLFATKDRHRFHNQMLAHFFDDNSIAHRWLDDETLEFDGDTVKVAGGGRFLYRRELNLLELWDNSQAYGRFNETGIEVKIHAAEHPWSSVRVTVR